MLRLFASRCAGQLRHTASVQQVSPALGFGANRAGYASNKENKEEKAAEGESSTGFKHAASDMPPGDTGDVAPEYYKDGDSDVAGVPSGVSARPSQSHSQERMPPGWDPPKGEPSAPDFEKRLSRDPHEANIPDYPGLNVKNQAEADKKDERLPSGGIEQPEKLPGNWPGTKSDRVSGYFPGGDVSAPTQSAPSGEAEPATESSPGPTGGKFVEGGNIQDEADPVGIKWGEKPDDPMGKLAKGAYQNR